MTEETNPSELIEDLDGGVFAQKIGAALSQVAGGVVEHGRKGRVSITLDLERIGNSSQVKCAHKLTYKQPTSKGAVSEDNTTETPLYVNAGGELTLFPKDQGQMFDKNGETQEQEA